MPLDEVIWATVRNFPETLLISSEFDPARPSSERLGKKLKALGAAPSEVVVYPQVPHGFANLPRLFRTRFMNTQYLRAWSHIRAFINERTPHPMSLPRPSCRAVIEPFPDS
jgi:acetyl esterase/lipase